MSIKKEISKNPSLAASPSMETELKEYLVNYAGEKNNPETGDITVAMIIETLADEFPEVVLALAEENFLRGYQQAFNDIEATTESFKTLESDE